MCIVGGIHRLAANIFVDVTKPILDRSPSDRIEVAESTRQVAKTQDGVPAHVKVVVPGEMQAYRARPLAVISVKSDRDDHSVQLFGIRARKGGFNLLARHRIYRLVLHPAPVRSNGEIRALGGHPRDARVVSIQDAMVLHLGLNVQAVWPRIHEAVHFQSSGEAAG